MARIESSPAGVFCPGDVAFAEHDGGRSVVWLRGEHDLATVGALFEIVARAIAFGDADVVLDLSAVEFMDASTVGVIIAASELLGRGSRSLVLRSPSRCARRLIELCGLSDLLETVDAGPDGAASALGTWVAVPAVSPETVADHVVASSDLAASGSSVAGPRRIVSDVG